MNPPSTDTPETFALRRDQDAPEDSGCCRPTAPATGALADSDHRKGVDRRLARIEGQVRGVRKMVDDQRWCLDVLVQVEAIQEGLRGVAAELLSAHLRHCVVDAARAGDAAVLSDRLAEIDVLLKRRRG